MNFIAHGAWYTAHLWSLSAEEQFYILWPFAVRLPQRSWTPITLAAFFSNIGFGVFHRLFGIRLSGLNPAVRGVAFPFVRGSIAIGCLLAIWEKSIRRIGCRLFAHRAGISLIPLILIVDAFSRESISAAALDLLLVFFVARCVFHPHDVIGRFVSVRPMRFIGKLSYSLYLWQQLFFHYSFVPMFPLNVVATAGLANASYFRKAFSEAALESTQEGVASRNAERTSLCVVEKPGDRLKPGTTWTLHYSLMGQKTGERSVFPLGFSRGR